mmetsp:Transcript_8384/g.23854  ORF Transcript_8384/g.23854 Transcript_8384/m.23854 type:complete len:215 (-) Transcript_8384:346-990(-)
MWMLEAVPLGADPFGRSCQCGQEDHHDVIHGLDELVRLSVVVVKVPPVADNTRTLLDIVDAHEPSEVGPSLFTSNDALHDGKQRPVELEVPIAVDVEGDVEAILLNEKQVVLVSRSVFDIDVAFVIRSVSTPHDDTPLGLTHQLMHRGPKEIALVSNCPLPVPQFAVHAIDSRCPCRVVSGIMDVLTQLGRHDDLWQRLLAVGPDHLPPRDSRS